jgi:hypothetical protein
MLTSWTLRDATEKTKIIAEANVDLRGMNLLVPKRLTCNCLSIGRGALSS